MSAGQVPSVGRILHTHVDNVLRPAIVTAVHSDQFVDVKIFAGISDLYVQTIELVDDPEEARRRNPEFGMPVCVFWPPRV